MYTAPVEINPDDIDISPQERHKLLIGCIVPRPIAFVSTVSPAGAMNLAPSPRRILGDPRVTPKENRAWI